MTLIGPSVANCISEGWYCIFKEEKKENHETTWKGKYLEIIKL